MAPLPGFRPAHGAAALGGWQIGVSRYSRQPELAWRFAALYDRREHAEAHRPGDRSGADPPRRSTMIRKLARSFRKLKSLLETFKQAAPRPVTPVYAPLSNIMQRYFSSALALRNTDIDKRASFAGRDMNRVLDLLRDRRAP
jgi:maltose-binding protein MalE